MRKRRHTSAGFTLVETLIALVLVTILSLIALQAFGPWMAFKAKLDTERKLGTVRTALVAAYDANAYAVDDQARNGAFHFTAGTLASSTVSSGYCSSQQDNWQALGPFITESAANFERDGHGNTLCVLVSNRLATVRDGATIFYRVIAVVSPGSNGVLDVDTTNFATTGVLSFDSEEGAIDDTAVVINGFDIQMAKARTARDRLERVATLYENYFTTRYLGNPQRDITVDYFANTWGDEDGIVAPTNGAFQPVGVHLVELGVGGTDALTPYELNNSIEVANTNEAEGGVTARSPAAGASPPYTALFRAPLPGGVYLVKVAVGNY